jgi:hypothetical protein
MHLQQFYITPFEATYPQKLLQYQNFLFKQIYAAVLLSGRIDLFRSDHGPDSLMKSIPRYKNNTWIVIIYSQWLDMKAKLSTVT